MNPQPTHPKIIFIHNTTAEYRQPLFSILKKEYADSIAFWFYKEKTHTFLGKYFSYVSFPINFSIGILFALFQTPAEIIVLSGSHSYELPLLFLIAKLRRKKIIFWTETWNWPEMGLKSKFFFAIIKYIATQADYVLYPGKKVHEVYKALNIPQNRQFFIPNAARTLSRKAVSQHQTQYTLGFFGRPLPRKGLHKLLLAFSNLDNKKYTLLIHTDLENPEVKHLQKIYTNKNIQWRSQITGTAQLNTFFSTIDVFLYPSIVAGGVAEAWGLSINEALSANIPIVSTTAVAATYDLITPGVNGVILDYTQLENLPEAIAKSSSLDLKKLKKHNTEVLKTYNYSMMAQGFIEAIEVTL